LVENIKTPNDVSDKILQRFFSEVQVIHPARIAAINRNYGEYWAFDFFHEISLVIEGLFDSFFSAGKDKIIAKVNEFMTYRNISELDKLNYKVFLEKFEKDYNLYRGELRDTLKERIQLSFDKKIWEDAISEYGRGTGYRERVCSIYSNGFQGFSSKTKVKDEYDKEWEKIVNENSLAK